MQGLGRPIISFEDNQHGYRIVCVGKQIRWSKNWRTFPDFLSDYIKSLLTAEWGNAELAKPDAERHPILRWYRKVGEYHRVQPKLEDGRVQLREITGAVRAYLGLAYDLYLCAHNAELPDLLLKRLRNPETFEGALYEAYVIGILAKAGFDIELEDESDSSRSHCELTAAHRETKRKFSVEAKAVASVSTRAGLSKAPPRIRGKLFDALRKRADHERLIFIELNRVGTGGPSEKPEWIQHVEVEIQDAERNLTIDGQAAPPAYVFVTNRGFIHALDSTRWTEVGLACGYKIADFAFRMGARTMLELVNARDKHVEMHWLRKALYAYSIPSTFDDHLPEEEVDSNLPRLLIGSNYQVPNEGGENVPGLLVDACVLEEEGAAYGVYKLDDGRHITCKTPLTETELAVYRRSPLTFLVSFGQ